MRTGQVWPLAYLPLLASRVFSMVGTGPPPPFLSASQDLKLPLWVLGYLLPFGALPRLSHFLVLTEVCQATVSALPQLDLSVPCGRTRRC